MTPHPTTPDLDPAEIRHRLANCFQLINGLIQLRMRTVSGEEARHHLMWLAEAIGALGLLQQKLVTSPEFELGDYLTEAVGFWNRLGYLQGVRVTLAFDAGVELERSRVPTLALVIHELVTNAIAHAFGNGPGDVALTLRRSGDTLEVEVRDSGSGFDPGTSPAGHLGLSLVAQLVQQLGGTFAIDGNAGTTARVRMPLS